MPEKTKGDEGGGGLPPFITFGGLRHRSVRGQSREPVGRVARLTTGTEDQLRPARERLGDVGAKRQAVEVVNARIVVAEVDVDVAGLRVARRRPAQLPVEPEPQVLAVGLELVDPA